jgi:hypothetical protein
LSAVRRHAIRKHPVFRGKFHHAKLNDSESEPDSSPQGTTPDPLKIKESLKQKVFCTQFFLLKSFSNLPTAAFERSEFQLHHHLQHRPHPKIKQTNNRHKYSLRYELVAPSPIQDAYTPLGLFPSLLNSVLRNQALRDWHKQENSKMGPWVPVGRSWVEENAFPNKYLSNDIGR